MKKLTLEEFIEKAKKVHGDKYDYSKVNYVNNYTKICIICPEHGEFYQTPSNHMGGAGCKFCSGNYQSNTKEFIEKAKKIHGDKYDYSKVNYITSRDKVCIICPEHGEFYQRSNSHLDGRGCPKCANDSTSDRHGMTTKEFIEKAKKVHGDKYDYSKVDYKNNRTKICIICPEHGEFYQTPSNHMGGAGCKFCSNYQSNTKEFIKKAKKVHGDRYDYSKVDYISSSDKVCIICPEHGEFFQTPNSHLDGQGCPRCLHKSKLESEIHNVLMTNNILFEPQKTWDWLKYKRSQFVDFYLPDYNIVIECQGLQHFQEIEFFGGVELYEGTKLRDKNKLDLCTQHGIKVLYYSNLGEDFEYPYEVFTDLQNLIDEIKKIGLTN